MVPPPPPPKKPFSPSNPGGPPSRDDLLADIRKGITLKRVRPSQGSGVGAANFSKSATLPRMAGENCSFNQSNHRTDPHDSQSPSRGTGFAKSGPTSNLLENSGQNDEIDLDSLPPSSLAPPPYKEESQNGEKSHAPPNMRPPPPSFPPPPPPLQNYSASNNVPPPPPPLSAYSTNQRSRGFQSANQNRSATLPKAKSEAVIDRSALLSEIQRGAKLRKVVVNDKSAPILERKGSGGVLLEQSENKPNFASPKGQGSARMHDQLIDELKNRRKNSDNDNSTNKIGLPKMSTDFPNAAEAAKSSSTTTGVKTPNFRASVNNETRSVEKSGVKYDQKFDAPNSDNSGIPNKYEPPTKVADTILSFQRKLSSSAMSDSENSDTKNSHEKMPPKVSPKPTSWNDHGRHDDDKSGQDQPGSISGERSPQLPPPQIKLNDKVSRVDESKAATPAATPNPSVVLIPPSPSNSEIVSPRRPSSSKKDSESSSGESVRSVKMFFNRSSTESESSSINDGSISDTKALPDSAAKISGSGDRNSINSGEPSEMTKASKSIASRPKSIEIDDVDNEPQGRSSIDGGSNYSGSGSASPRSKPSSPNFQTSSAQPRRTSPLISTNNRSPPSGLSSPTLANQRRPSPPLAINQNQPKSPQLEKKTPSPLSVDVRDAPTDSELISSSGKKMSPIGNSSSPSAPATPQADAVFTPSTGINYKSSRVDNSSDYSYVAKQVVLSSSPNSGQTTTNLHSGGTPSIFVEDIKPKLSSPAAAYVPTKSPNADSGTKNRGTNSSENLAEVARMNNKNRLNSSNSDRPQPTPTSLTGPKIDIESLIEAEKLVNPARFNEGPLRNSGVRKVSKNDVSTLINERLKERAIYDKLVTAVAATSGEDMPAFSDFKQTLPNGNNGTLKQNSANKLFSDASYKDNNNGNNMINNNNAINNSSNSKNSSLKLGQSNNTSNGIGNTRKPSPPTVFAKPAKSGYLLDAENDSTNQNTRPDSKKSSMADQEPTNQNHARLAEWQQLSASRQGGTYELIEQAKREIETSENDRRMNERHRYQATVEDRLNETILANKSPITFSNPGSNSSSPAVTRKHVEAANQAAKRLWDTVNELEDSFPAAPLSSGPTSPAGNGNRPSLHASPNPYDSGSGVRRTGVGIEVKRSVGGGAFEEMPLVDRNSRGQYVTKQRENLPSSGSAPGSPSPGAGGNAMMCTKCGNHLNGKFVQEGSDRWCPNCLVCAMPGCGSSLIGIGHIKIDGEMICENCFKMKLAPKCGKCGKACMTEIVDALGSKWHPECFVCAHCDKQFPDGKFLEHDGLAYCRKDWNDLFGKKCTLCKQVVQAGELWVEVSGNVYHSNCFLCTKCQEPIHGEFISRNEKPYCKNHA